MIDLFDIFDLYQQRKIGELAGLHANTSERLTKAGDNLRDLEQRHERLRLITIAMWQLLKEHTGLTDTDLKRFIEKVDLTDGKLDGKLAKQQGANDCSGCGRRILKSSTRCPWCGAQSTTGNAFLST